LLLSAREVATIFVVFALVSVDFKVAERMRDIATHLGRSPSGWALYGLLVPGVSYLHLMSVRRRTAPGCGITCRLQLTDGRSTAVIAQRGALWELEFPTGDRLGCLPEDRLAPDVESVRLGVPFKGVLWILDGERARRVALPGQTFVVRPHPSKRYPIDRPMLMEGEVVSLLQASTWEETRGALKTSD
jgi:hypothetical protein